MKKYTLYAIGEILLVVIGILIALQINNWNEDRKAQVKEEIILQDLYKDLESNVEVLETKIKSLDNRRYEINYILKYFNQSLPYSDSLQIYLWRMRFTNELSFNTSAFESLKSTGFDIIKSKDLKIEIIQLFDQEYKSNAQWINNLSLKKYESINNAFTNLPIGDLSKNYNAFLKNKEWYNILNGYFGFLGTSKSTELDLKEKTLQIKALIF